MKIRLQVELFNDEGQVRTVEAEYIDLDHIDADVYDETMKFMLPRVREAFLSDGSTTAIASGLYLHDWSETGRQGLLFDFRITEQELEGAEILLASYTYESYSGSAYVLFRRGGELYEVHGSHCSCYGLEEQWDPEEISREALEHRLGEGSWGEEGRVKEELLKIVASL